jgi:hypothetical protein
MRSVMISARKAGSVCCSSACRTACIKQSPSRHLGPRKLLLISHLLSSSWWYSADNGIEF